MVSPRRRLEALERRAGLIGPSVAIARYCQTCGELVPYRDERCCGHHRDPPQADRVLCVRYVHPEPRPA
jgi:hypothetical protein